MPKLTPKEEKRLNRLEEYNEFGDLYLLRAVDELAERIEEVAVQNREVVSEIREELKKKPEFELVFDKEELKGDKGDSYILTEEDKKDIAKWVVVPTVVTPPVVEKVTVTERVIEKPMVTHEIVEKAVPDTPAQTRDKLESLEGKERLSWKAIDGLEPKFKESSDSLTNWALGVLDSRTSYLINKINDVQRLIGTSSSSSSSSGGILPVTISGTIDDDNTSFTAPNDFTFLVVNGAVYQKTGGAITWSYSAGTVTISSPVGTGGSIYGLKSSAVETKTLSYVVGSPTSSLTFPLGQSPDYNITITKIKATAFAGTSVTFNIQERADASLNSSGTNIMTSSLVADADGAVTTTFSNAGIASYSHLVFVASAMSGTVTSVTILIEYTID